MTELQTALSLADTKAHNFSKEKIGEAIKEAKEIQQRYESKIIYLWERKLTPRAKKVFYGFNYASSSAELGQTIQEKDGTNAKLIAILHP